MLYSGALLVLAAGGAAVGFRAARDRPPLLFMGAWLSLVLAGAVLWLPGLPGPAGVSYLSPLFPAAQLAGVLALLYGRAPVAVGAVAIALGIARAAVTPDPAFELWIGVTIEPLTSLVAGALLARRAHQDRAPAIWYAAAAVIALAGVADGVSGAVRTYEGTVPIPLAVGWLVLASAGLPLQLQLQARRD